MTILSTPLIATVTLIAVGCSQCGVMMCPLMATVILFVPIVTVAIMWSVDIEEEVD